MCVATSCGSIDTGEDERLAAFFPEKGEGWLDSGKSMFPVNLAGFWTIQVIFFLSKEFEIVVFSRMTCADLCKTVLIRVIRCTNDHARTVHVDVKNSDFSRNSRALSSCLLFSYAATCRDFEGEDFDLPNRFLSVFATPRLLLLSVQRR